MHFSVKFLLHMHVKINIISEYWTFELLNFSQLVFQLTYFTKVLWFEESSERLAIINFFLLFKISHGIPASKQSLVSC